MHQQLSSRVQTVDLATAAAASGQSPAAQLHLLAAALAVQLLLLLDCLGLLSDCLVLDLLLLLVGLLLLCLLAALLLPLARLLLLHWGLNHSFELVVAAALLSFHFVST
jgi:hypothetical protein